MASTKTSKPKTVRTRSNTNGASKRDILRIAKTQGVQFLRLQFTDITGVNKNIEVPASQFEKAVNGEVMFDGSSIEGFVRIEESDMILNPDLDTFQIFPENGEGGKVARLICDIYTPDGNPFQGCPRLALKKQIAVASKMGYSMMAGVEAEFFLFNLDDDGRTVMETHDTGGYFDMTPIDQGEPIRRLIVEDLEHMGLEVEAGHHEVAPGQHEIDFKYADALTTADDLTTFKFVVRNIAFRHGFAATFMPKPIEGQNGSGMHTHQSLFKDGKNAFFDSKTEWQLSKTALAYIGGLLEHAAGMVSVTNPLINSFKRLVPKF